MGGHSGGVAAAFGFRYQYLITVELLLDLYESAGGPSWHVDVDCVGQDSADILVSASGGEWDVAVQVKGSLETSSTTMGLSQARDIFARLAAEHPGVPERRLVTNRSLTAHLTQAAVGSGEVWHAAERFEADRRTLAELTQELVRRIEAIRRRGAGGVGVHHILVRQLLDLVHERGSDPTRQRITRHDVDQILSEPAALLADAVRERSWGRAIQMPPGRPIAQEEADSFLTEHLPLASLVTGSVRCAVLTGLSGTGKTSAAVRLALQRLESLAFVLWLDASDEASLVAQMPRVMDELGSQVDVGDPASTLSRLLGDLPVPWLLVLDRAGDPALVERWIPQSGYGHVVVTAARADWPSWAPSLAKGGFTKEEARHFVASRLDAPVKRWSDAERAACDELVRRLEHWPLALELATSWIRQRGAKVSSLQAFVDRIDRLDLDDSTLVPEGYPATAYGVVVDLVAGLPVQAQTWALGLLMLGGRRVPVALLDEWARSLGLQPGSREELIRTGVITLSIEPDRRGPHAYDELADIHDSIQLVLRRTGVGIPGEAVASLIEVCADQLALLVEHERFVEASTLVTPVDKLLHSIVTSDAEPSLTLLATVLMHNVGSLALVVDTAGTGPDWATQVASRWLATAVDLRRQIGGEDFDQAGAAAMQVETIGSWAVALHRLRQDEDLELAAEYAVRLGERHGAALGRDRPLVSEAFRMIRQASTLRSVGGAELAARLHRLEDITSSQSAPGATDGGLLMALQREMDRAIDLIASGRWGEGVAIGLASADSALENGALVEKMIDGVLDLSVGLLTEVARRPGDWDRPLRALNGVVEWLSALDSKLLTSGQRARRTLLTAAVSADSGVVRQAVGEVERESHPDEQLTAWLGMTRLLEKQFAAVERLRSVANTPPGISVVSSGSELSYWEAVHPFHRVPTLFVYSGHSFSMDATGRHDLARQEFVSAGLEEVAGPEDPLPKAVGWEAHFLAAGLFVFDAAGRALVQEISATEEFRAMVRRAGGVLLVYQDPANRDVGEAFAAPTGWVSLPSSSRSWWKRLVGKPGRGNDVGPSSP